MKKIAILGSTGSIGQSALNLVDLYPERFRVSALAARRYSKTIYEQCKRYHPDLVALAEPGAAEKLAAQIIDVRVVSGIEGVIAAASETDADMVVSAVTGAAGLVPTYHAIRAGKSIALANKETMVMAGELLVSLAARKKVTIIPVDSEHSALHQCLRASGGNDVRRLILTASGGPFLRYTREQLDQARVADALAHPTWEMGPKITVDSATLMNKGLEVIEAHHFFGSDPGQISVVVHPQSIIHSIVEFIDGTMLAQLSITDMRSSLLYALAYPERWDSRLPSLDLLTLASLDFEPPDTDRFPCLKLAYAALEAGDTYPTALNAANEVAVELFLLNRLPFTRIAAVIEKTLQEHVSEPVGALEGVLEADRRAREKARRLANRVTSQRRV